MGIIKFGGKIEKINANSLSYSEFVDKYMSSNQPVILTGLMNDWRACKDWVLTQTLNSHNEQVPNLQYFSTNFGNSKVQVADCGTREFTDQKRDEMSVNEFIDHWLPVSTDECSEKGKPLLYLKDWHFVKEYPEYVAYKTPLFFADDWLNIYLNSYQMHKDNGTGQEDNDICCSDYRFVYMGAKGTWTPLHADVFRSYSWSANVCGKKKWVFLPPSQSHLVFDRNGKNCIYNIFDDIDETKFPGFNKTIWFECTQEKDEIIFVPSGWYHQVHNMEDTISINHNWFNSYNLSWVWDLLLRDYIEAKEYIADIKDICDDFEGLCQRNLAANTGMNFYGFFLFISRFVLANIVHLNHLYRDHGEKGWNISPVARNFSLNISSIRKIALQMKSVGALFGNRDFFDLRECLDDSDFRKLCIGLGRTYGLIHRQENLGYDTKYISLLDFGDSCPQICTPEDLVEFIDNAISRLSIISTEENSLLRATV
ncbi:hypothetical protein ACFE04_028352 [Oxalis oulophora]